MGCGASAAGRYALEEPLPGARPTGIQRSVHIGGGVYRKAGFEEALVSTPPDAPDVKTAWDILERGSRVYADVSCLGSRRFEDFSAENLSSSANVQTTEADEGKAGTWREYVWTTYAEFHQLALHFGKGFVDTFPMHRVGAHIGIYGPRSVQQLVAQYGCFSQGLIVTQICDTWHGDMLQYVITHADLDVLIVAGSQLANVKCALQEKSSKVVACIALPQPDFVEITEQDISIPRGTISVHGYQKFIDKGSESKNMLRPPEPCTCAVIMYTSGTTGLPKGVQLTHESFVGVAEGFREASKECLKTGTIVASFLPLGHIHPTVTVLASFLSGCSIGLCRGDMAELLDDLQALRPEVFPGLPRIYHDVYAKIVETFNEQSFVAQRGIDNALKKQTLNIRNGVERDIELDRKVFSQIQAQLGGELKYFTTGASAMRPALQEWLKVCFNAGMAEGYSLTEACGCVLAQEPGWDTLGDVGVPLCSTEVRLLDVPDLGYSSQDKPPRGELCIRSVSMMQAYYKEPEKSKRKLKRGWLQTGDLARRNADGTFSIIDRICNVFKLARSHNGVRLIEVVEPEAIENQLATCSLVNQVWVYGNSELPYLVAVVVPQASKLFAKAGSNAKFKQEGWKEELERICGSGQAVTWITQEMTSLVTTNKIKEWQRPQRIHVETKVDDMGLGFNLANGLLTPTFKVRRGIMQTIYADVIEDMYSLDKVKVKKSY